MNIFDIEDALELRNMAGVEAGFNYLVAGRAPLIGTTNVQDVFDLLDRLTAALEADRNRMPAELMSAIYSPPGAVAVIDADRSFAAGARSVASRNHKWRKRFVERLHSAGDAPSFFASLHDVRSSATE